MPRVYKRQNIEAEICFFNSENDFEVHEEGFYNRIIRSIGKYISTEVLEAGCGSGAFGQRIKNSIPNIVITGVDLNEKLVSLARQKNFYKELKPDNLEKNNLFEENSFDTIICPYILHHFPNMSEVFKNFNRWLKPGGRIIIIDPNGSNLVMKTSYCLRILLSKFSEIKNAASINERPKTMKEFKKNLKGYRIIHLETFDYYERHKELRKKLPRYADILVGLRNGLVKLTKGSQIIIVAEKNKE